MGGCLHYSNLTQDQIQPILLPKNQPVTVLIIRYFHLSYFHTAPQLLLCAIRQIYWILSGRFVARKIEKNCVTRARTSASMTKQTMADLPFGFLLECNFPVHSLLQELTMLDLYFINLKKV